MGGVKWLVVVAATVAGCSSYDRGLPSRYEFQVEGDAAVQGAFADALTEWRACGVVQGEMVAASADAYPVPVRPVDSFAKVEVVAWTGLSEMLPEIIQYRRDHGRLREVFAHELGHAFTGTSEHHVSGLMAPSLTSEPQHVGPDECEMLHRHR